MGGEQASGKGLDMQIERWQVNRQGHGALWVAAFVAIGLYAVQLALADSDYLILRYVIALGVTGGAVFALSRAWRGDRPRSTVEGPDPINLTLAGLAALSVWAAAWWLMDLVNNRLYDAFGPLPYPTAIIDFSDRLLGVNIQPAAYELEILIAVVLLPLAQSWLLHGAVQGELARQLGGWRAAWITGGVAGIFLAAAAVQDVAPAMPWGVSAVGGYLIAGCVAAVAVRLIGSVWAAVAVHGTFAYATFALRDDLFRQFLGKGYFDLGWLTVILVGGFAAVVLLQLIRFRDSSPSRDEATPSGANPPHVILPLVLLASVLIVMAAVEIDARRSEQAVRERATSAVEVQ